MCDPEEAWTKLAEIEGSDQQRRWEGCRHGDSTTTIAMLNIRELARKTEEAAVVLEGAGFHTLPGELLDVSRRLIEIREALERVLGQR